MSEYAQFRFSIVAAVLCISNPNILSAETMVAIGVVKGKLASLGEYAISMYSSVLVIEW